MALLDEAMAAVVGGRARSGRGRLRLLRDDRHLLQARGVRAGGGMDRGHPAVVRAAVRPRLPRGLPDPQGRADAAPRLAGQAEEEARMACEELPRFNFFSGLGPANYEIGEVRRRLGDLRGAEEAFARAHEFGFSPQPGLSLLRLAQGKVDAAAAGIRQALTRGGREPLSGRSGSWPHRPQIALAAGRPRDRRVCGGRARVDRGRRSGHRRSSALAARRPRGGPTGPGDAAGRAPGAPTGPDGPGRRSTRRTRSAEVRAAAGAGRIRALGRRRCGGHGGPGGAATRSSGSAPRRPRSRRGLPRRAVAVAGERPNGSGAPSCSPTS